MAKHIFLLVVSVALVIVATDRPLAAQDVVVEPVASQVGRYQMLASEGRIYILDTATGQCWSRRPEGAWRSEGNPTKHGEGTGEVDDSPRLELPGATVEMTVLQREERSIPGSDGTIRVRLGDITEGQALLSVVAADGNTLLEKTSIRQGDKVEFSIAKKRYVLQIHELRNILLGDDFAKIYVSEATDKAPPK